MPPSFEALDRAEEPAVRDFIASDAILHIPGSHPLSGRYEGWEGFLEYIQKAVQADAGTGKSELLQLFADGRGHVVALSRTTAQRAGRKLDQQRASILTVADGRVVEVNQCDEDIDVSNEFWS